MLIILLTYWGWDKIAVILHTIFSHMFPWTLQWRHNGRDSVSNHQPHDCLLNHLFRRSSKKTSKLCGTGLCAGNSPLTGKFPAQMASNAENVSIWWRHHEVKFLWILFLGIQLTMSQHDRMIAWCRTGDMAIMQTNSDLVYGRIFASLGHYLLSHWGRDKMAVNFLTTFSNAFSLMKMYESRLRFH